MFGGKSHKQQAHDGADRAVAETGTKGGEVKKDVKEGVEKVDEGVTGEVKNDEGKKEE